MKVKVINTGKSIPEAEMKVQAALDSINISKLISVTDSGLRVIIVYEEKKVAKGLTEKADTSNIRERKEKTKEVIGETKDATNNRAGSKKPRRAKKSGEPKK